MDTLIVGLAKEWGGLGLALLVGMFLLLDKSGLVKRWSESSAGAAKARMDEREQLSEDQQEFVNNLRADIDNLRQWRAQDNEECEKKLRRLSDRLDAMFEDNQTWRRDAAKWRHLSGNLAMHVNKMRGALQQHGIDAPRFDGWDRFLAEGGDASEFDFEP